MGSSVCKPVHIGKRMNNDYSANNINVTEKESVNSVTYEKTPKYSLTNTNVEQEKAETSKPRSNIVLQHTSKLKKRVSFENFPLPNKQRVHVKLTNHTNKTYFSNIQYNQSCEGIPCSGLRCKGSIVNGSTRDYGVLKTRSELIKEAKDFIDSYFRSVEKFNSHEHSERWAEISKSINWTGTYQLKYNELCFGCKLAWRNAPRCIGRIQWNILQVFDARNAKTCSDMFDAICRHIRYCTNKGKIRSGITVFPHKTGKDELFRIWNSQFIRYAGYQQPDGSIIGDPVSVEFTEVCQKLGWKGEGTMFDVLPLVLQINENDPEVFELPEDIVLEVSLKHPKFPWFEDLGLKWYGLPTVANMIFECGGLIFTAAPFSGWYMSTEIGARNLCDVQRYNLTEIVANRMDLDTNSMTTLWKDKAILEVNIAVLYSFQQEGVTITDHHSASESFMKFMADENRLRGGCPADWVWIIPPISGSATQVFHQEMLMYKLKPSFEYVQSDPWSSHSWKSNKLKIIFEKPKTSFKTLCWLAMTVAILMRALALKRVNCTILYATVTGNALRYARVLERMFKNAFNVQLKCTDEYSLKDMENERFVLMVASTFGNGDAPECAMHFAKEIRMVTARRRSIFSKGSRASIYSLQKMIEEENDKTDKDISLKNVRYSVFGLGSRAYPYFCGFAHFLDTSLRIIGADSIHPVGEGDELNGQEMSFAKWAKGVFQECVKTYRITDEECIKRAMKQIEHADTSWAPQKFLLMPTEVKPDNLVNSLSALHSTAISSCTVKRITQLQSKESSRQTLLIEMLIDNGDGLSYEPGDHIGIYPANNEKDVNYIISRFAESVMVDEPLKVVRYVRKTSTAGTVNVLSAITNIPICTIRTALEHYLDINTPPTQMLLKEMAEFATEKTDEGKLLDLAEDSNLYKTWRNEKYPSICDVLKEFPSVKVYPEFLLTQFPALKERFYSISSSPLVYPGEVHLTVGLVKYNKNDGCEYEGVCSSWFNRLDVGATVACRIHVTPVFHLPENRSLPIIMIGAGTGIAPFRSFWQQRKYDIDMGVDEEFGDMYLFFGCRDPATDDIYHDELREAEKEGVITKVFHAYSREKGKQKVYVQDVIQKNNQLITSGILKKDGHIYVCGETNMAKEIASTLVDIIQRNFVISSHKAVNIVQGLRDSNRYHEELFGPSVIPKY